MTDNLEIQKKAEKLAFPGKIIFFSSIAWNFITAKHKINTCVSVRQYGSVVVDCGLGSISLYKVEGVGQHEVGDQSHLWPK